MSESPVAKKLKLKTGQKVVVLHAPEGYTEQLGPEVTITDKLSGQFDVVQLFIKDRAELDKYLPGTKKAIKPETILWIAYPKQSAKVKSDINRDTLREAAAAAGLRSVAMIAIDDTWSAMRFKVE